MQSKVDILEKENQALQQNNTMVSDSVALLSDRLAQLTYEIEILKKENIDKKIIRANLSEAST